MMSVNPGWMTEIGDLEGVVGTKVEDYHMGMMVDFNEERMTGWVKAVESPVEAWRDMDPCAADRWGEKVMPEHYGEVQNVMGKEISRPVGQVKNMVVEEINKSAVLEENETSKVIDKLDSLVNGKESGQSRGRVMGEGYNRYLSIGKIRLGEAENNEKLKMGGMRQ